jgi:hypothetical protein
MLLPSQVHDAVVRASTVNSNARRKDELDPKNGEKQAKWEFKNRVKGNLPF